MNTIKDDLTGLNISNTILSNTPAINKTGKEFLSTIKEETNIDDW